MKTMKKLFMLMVGLLTILSCPACTNEEAETEIENPDNTTEGNSGSYFSGKKVLVAYFSWGGTTQRMAQQIQDITGADIFRIEPVTPYPTSYTPCTEVALDEKNNNARPAIKDKVENWSDYDVVFIGCPVWWWTTPMIIHTFCESYDFKGKTVVPFCTYAATYRDETLAEIVNSTPDASHLTGEGLTSGRINTQTIQNWINSINSEWNTNNGGAAGVNNITANKNNSKQKFYSMNGTAVDNINNAHGVFIVKSGNATRKVIK